MASCPTHLSARLDGKQFITISSEQVIIVIDIVSLGDFKRTESKEHAVPERLRPTFGLASQLAMGEKVLVLALHGAQPECQFLLFCLESSGH